MCSLEQFFTTFVYTVQPLLSTPTTGIFPRAPRPLFPLILFAPEGPLSSTSTSPENLPSHWLSSTILRRNAPKYLVTCLREMPTCFAVKTVSKSSQTQCKSCLNLYSLSRDLLQYLFLIDLTTVVTH